MSEAVWRDKILYKYELFGYETHPLMITASSAIKLLLILLGREVGEAVMVVVRALRKNTRPVLVANFANNNNNNNKDKANNNNSNNPPLPPPKKNLTMWISSFQKAMK